MEGVVGYVQRSGRGAWVEDAFVAGEQAVDRWGPSQEGESGEGSVAPARARAAAAWIADRLVSREVRSRRLDRLIVDTDGAVLGWLDAPSPELGVVRAAAAQLESPQWNTSDADDGAVTIQPLEQVSSGGNGSAKSNRRAVLYAPDAGLRVLLDELDRARISVGEVESLWHTLCKAWDPGAQAEGDGPGTDRLVAESGVTTAVLLVDVRGRLVWSWSRDGELVAGGRMLLPRQGAEGASEESGRIEGPRGRVRIGEAEVARLASDWIAWGVQTGVSPSRVICVTPPIEGESIDELPDAGALGRRLGELWPQSSVEVLVEDDPVQETLWRARAARAPGMDESRRPGRSLIELSRRPGRAHRAMYVWTAAALFAASAALVIQGVRLRATAGELRTEQVALATAFREDAAEVLPRDKLQRPLLELGREIDSLKQRAQRGSGVDPAPPILDEFESLWHALLTLEVPFERIELYDIDDVPANEVVVWVPQEDSVRFGSRVLRAVERAPGSRLTGWEVDYEGSARGGKKEIKLRAKWVPEAGREGAS